MCLCVSVCVRESVCYNNGNFWEILRSAHPSGSKKELRVTSILRSVHPSGSKKELRVTHFCYLRLRIHSICNPPPQ
jgi:hypothetical protein